ncbi:serine hydrolase domain-containing protein [Glycocaulis sp.]|uniref:serine hydrolase domain-containing protein n=1 Tax=Glycocaulis sp. TaxID=1969725 RepID=UPI003F70AE52
MPILKPWLRRAPLETLICLCAAVAFLAATPLNAFANTPGTTGGGVGYTAPDGWDVRPGEGLTVLAAPADELLVALVDVGSADSASDAVLAAWALFDPDADYPVRLVTAASPREGWEERASVSYDIPPNERLAVQALALRREASWTVMIVRGSQAAQERRSAATSLIQQSLRPAGYERESFAGRTPNPLTPERIDLLREFVAEAMDTLDVPGVGLALIDQGEVVWQGGLGVRQLGADEPVTADTRFMIASNTKGMVTLLLATLADEGALEWDQPVTQVYPEFRLGSDETTRSTLMRHLVCACTGLPRKDMGFLLVEPGAPATDTFRQLADTQPTSAFGELFQYNNLLVSAAGYVGGALAYPGMELGAAFDLAMETRVFAPAGMHNSGFDFAEAMQGDWARPHGRNIDGEVVEISNTFNQSIETHRPAGGAWSTAADMARFVQLELSGGLTPEGERVVSEANLMERRVHNVPTGEDSWYGMGLFDEIAWGVPVVSHGGTLLGYRSNFYLLPEAGIGAVVLTNSDEGSVMLRPFLRRLMEVVYDGQPEAMNDINAAVERMARQSGARRATLTVPGDTAILEVLAAQYHNPETGYITIRDVDGETWLRAGAIEGPVATRRNADGTVSLVTVGAGAIGLEAVIGDEAGVATLTIRDSQHEYVYRAED